MNRNGVPSGIVPLAFVCCLPTVVIAVVLIVAGGTGPGFLIPAITCGAMIGMLMFQSMHDAATHG